MADDQGADIVLHELLKGLEPLLRTESIQIGALHPPYHLNPVGVKIVVKAGKLHCGPVNVGSFDESCLIVLGSVQGFELMFFHKSL